MPKLPEHEPDKFMKKWALIVAGLYGLAFLVLIGPLALIAFFPKELKLSELNEALLSWQLWAIVAVVITTQFALLRIPVQMASGRPVTQRPVWVTMLAAAFMMGLLVLGAAGSIYEFITKLAGPDPFLPLIALGLGSWVFWAIYFYRSTHSATPPEKVTRMRRYLWAGSILELLVAIPTHIIARQRDYCCAGMLTFVGLACGFSVMLLAFGPALYFLFAERWNRLHPKQQMA